MEHRIRVSRKQVRTAEESWEANGRLVLLDNRSAKKAMCLSWNKQRHAYLRSNLVWPPPQPRFFEHESIMRCKGVSPRILTLFRVHGASCSSGRRNRSRSGATRVERPMSSRCPTQRNVTVVCRRKTTRPAPTSPPPLGAVKPLGLDLFIEIIGFLWQPVGRARRRPKPVGARGAPGSGSPPRSPVRRPTGQTRLVSALRLASPAPRQRPASSPHGTSPRPPSSPCRPVPRSGNHQCPRGRSSRVRSRGP